MQVGRLQVAVLILVALMGCGGDDDDEKNTSSPSTGAGGANATPTEVACGGMACKPITGLGLDTPIVPCCADAFAGKCGGMVGTSCMALPEPDDECASVNNTSFGPMFSIVGIGCCVDDKCGVAGGLFPAECTDLETLRMRGMGMGMGMGGGGFLSNALPQPQACTE
jgi:hypothetical protein